jgi:hypothetical protein
MECQVPIWQDLSQRGNPQATHLKLVEKCAKIRGYLAGLEVKESVVAKNILDENVRFF